MQLAHQSDEGHYAVRRVGAGEIQIGERRLTRSLLLAPDRCVEEFPPRTFEEFDDAAIATILPRLDFLVWMAGGGSGNPGYCIPPGVVLTIAPSRWSGRDSAMG